MAGPKDDEFLYSLMWGVGRSRGSILVPRMTSLALRNMLLHLESVLTRSNCILGKGLPRVKNLWEYFLLNILKSLESWSGTFLSSNMYSAVLTSAVVDILSGEALNSLSVLSVVGYGEGPKSC